MWVPYGKTRDGFEQQIGVNHLGHFAVTSQLFDLLKRTGNSRIVNISSTGHRFGDMDFDNFLFEEGRDYTPMKAYGRSKLANLLFTYELQRRIEKAGLDVKVLAAHPDESGKACAGPSLVPAPLSAHVPAGARRGGRIPPGTAGRSRPRSRRRNILRSGWTLGTDGSTRGG